MNPGDPDQHAGPDVDQLGQLANELAANRPYASPDSRHRVQRRIAIATERVALRRQSTMLVTGGIAVMIFAWGLTLSGPL